MINVVFGFVAIVFKNKSLTRTHVCVYIYIIMKLINHHTKIYCIGI